MVFRSVSLLSCGNGFHAYILTISSRHEDMAKNMDVTYPSFVDENPDIVHGTKHAMATYVKGLAGSLAGETNGNDSDIILRPYLQTKTDADGWPIITAAAWGELSKRDLEHIYRHYLAKHYSMGSNFQSHVGIMTNRKNRTCYRPSDVSCPIWRAGQQQLIVH